MTDAIIQLYRNGLCCIKDLEWLQDTLPFLWDPSVTRSYVLLPEPMDKTTPLEVLIAIGQAYAFLSATQAGMKMLTNSFGKLRRIDRLIKARTLTKSSKTDADRLINASLLKEAKFAIRFMFIGFNVFCIGAAFFWLTANSFHVTETDWIGGLPAVIHALTAAEVSLLFILWFMWKDAGEQFSKAARMERLATELKAGSLTSKKLGLATLESLTGWLPFWDAGVDPLASIPDPKEEEKLMEKEKMTLEKSIRDIVGDEQTDEKKGEKEDKIRQKRQEEKAAELMDGINVTRLEGYREYLYFVLNCIAFYGYMMSIIVYYFDDEDKKPSPVRNLLMGMENSSADWHGNFAGDLMWTVEPVLILGTPTLFNYMKPRKTKVKAD
jgi:hypothetical protein